jgi:hypothetical protein
VNEYVEGSISSENVKIRWIRQLIVTNKKIKPCIKKTEAKEKDKTQDYYLLWSSQEMRQC